MPDEDIEKDDSTNVPSEEDANTEEVEETTVEVEPEDGQPEYTEAEKKAFARAKKAEAEVKSLKAQLKTKPEPQSTPSEKGSLTTTVKELKAISDLEDEDAEYLVTYADKFGVSLADARKNKDVQAVLSVRAEERRTAAAANTGPSRRGTSKVSDDKLLEKARTTGELPTTDEDMDRLVSARLGLNK